MVGQDLENSEHEQDPDSPNVPAQDAIGENIDRSDNVEPFGSDFSDCDPTFQPDSEISSDEDKSALESMITTKTSSWRNLSSLANKHMSFRELLTEKQLEEEAARIMDGEDDDPESFDDSDGSDFQEDNLEVESSSSDSELDEDNNSAACLIQQAFSPIQSEEEIEPRLDEDDIPLS
ncbi:hypothetical protein JTB14_020747 [Gonioctena quinquepunctata]|nr:hypothetical protein JTB14_020747 [Gonioctena quinquepunctata]